MGITRGIPPIVVTPLLSLSTSQEEQPEKRNRDPNNNVITYFMTIVFVLISFKMCVTCFLL